MVETILITTILLAVFLCLRRMLDGKISARLQYSVWLLIALRLLLVWIPLPGSSVSVMNLLPVVQDSFQSLHQNVFGEKTEKEGGDTAQNSTAQAEGEMAQKDTLEKNAGISQNVPLETNVQLDGEKQLKSASSESGSVAASLPTLFYRIYGIGVVLMLLWMIAKNVWFWRGLCRRRVLYEGQLPVASLPGNLYLVDHLESPFLFGRHIYVSPKMLSNQQKLQHILVHETCHWKQGDSFWSVLRCLCLAGYWYHPLVWYGVSLSIVDAELACDERVIRILGEESRHGYGETLLGLIRERTAFQECTCMSTQMSGSKRETKKRLERIVKQGKRRKGRILFLVVSMLVLCMVTLPGKKMEKDAVTEKEWKRVEQEGFPCIVVDDQGNIVGTRRGELLQKVILDYTNSKQDSFKYQIQADAFSACPNLKALILPNRNLNDLVLDYIDYIDPDAFRGCSEDLVVYCHKRSYAWTRLQELGITVKEALDEDWYILEEDTAALKRIQKKRTSAANNSTLTEQEMRKFYGEPFFMMTESGELFFEKCESLSQHADDYHTIYLPRDAKTMEGTFANFIMQEQPITIPKNIVEIGEATFFAGSLVEINFEEGSNLQTIGRQAFLGATFTEVQLPEGLQKIEEEAFDTCENLVEITIPESVNTIGSHCFRLCGSLERVVILNPNVTLGEDIFDDEILDPKLGEGEIDMNDLDSNFIPNYRLTIVCHKGSTAEKYAREHGLQVEYLK